VFGWVLSENRKNMQTFFLAAQAGSWMISIANDMEKTMRNRVALFESQWHLNNVSLPST